MGLRLNSEAIFISTQQDRERPTRGPLGELLDGVTDLSRTLVRSARSAVESTLTKSTRVHGTVKGGRGRS